MFLQFSAVAYILTVNCAKITTDTVGHSALEIFSIEPTSYVFNHQSFNRLGLSSLSHGGLKFWHLIFYCMLCTDFPGGRTDAVARHVSFAEISCIL